ncbi:hypothetical protein C2W62_24685 [Candidatus Entotheonella serta]|nr:hypothetical protein C2W62_24685 [Candidatus Entotheonella serta]
MDANMYVVVPVAPVMPVMSPVMAAMAVHVLAMARIMPVMLDVTRMVPAVLARNAFIMVRPIYGVALGV